MALGRGTIVAVVVLLSSTVLACGGSSKTTVTAASSSSSSSVATTSTSTTTTTTSTTLEVPTTTAVLSTTTSPPDTAPPATEPPPTVPGAGATWSIAANSGARGVVAQTSGNGCQENGSGTGLFWRITLYDQMGVATSGDGGTVDADGTWSVPEAYGAVGSPAGQYRVAAACLKADYTVLFDYADKYYTVTD